VPQGIFNVDVDDQAPNNYEYDEIGELIKDDAEGIKEIKWRADQNVKEIIKDDGSRIVFEYDAMGKRILNID
jgi:DNA helicase IV